MYTCTSLKTYLTIQLHAIKREVLNHGADMSDQELNASLVQRARPDVFRYRLRQALTLEVYRWQKQIEFGRFDEESFHECALLLKAIKEERLSAMMQLEVLNRLAGKGMLMSLQERRPKLHRHLGFLDGFVCLLDALGEMKEPAIDLEYEFMYIYIYIHMKVLTLETNSSFSAIDVYTNTYI